MITAVKGKTGIYIDRGLRRKFKKHALRKGIEVSNLLEGVLDVLLLKFSGQENCYEVNFEPIEPKKGPVSELIRVVRDVG